MEALAPDITNMTRTPLAPEHVVRMREIGTYREVPAGEFLVRFGEPIEQFYYLEEGELEAINALTGQRYGVATLGPTQFFGEISFLSGGTWLLGSRAVQDSKVLCVEREAMLDLMRQIPEMSDIIVTVLAGRRRRLLETNESALTIIGAEDSKELREIAAFAGRNRIPVQSIPLHTEEAEEKATECALPNEPALIFGKNNVIEDPTPTKLAQLLGLDLAVQTDEVFDVLIVGGGPGGVAAGVYAGAEGLSALVLEDLTIGGQAGTSSRIENYMGFPTGISGADLCWRGEVQAMKFGTRFAVPRRAESLFQQDDGSFCVTLDNGRQVCARSIVVATGVQYRRLPIDRLEEFEGSGIYYAATDVEARYCRGDEVAIIGGGNSAGQAAMFLSRSTKHVHLLVRGPSLAASMSDYLSSRLEAEDHITVHYNTQMSELCGEDRLDGINVIKSEDLHRLNTSAVFVMVGAAPNTGWISGHVELDDKGFVKTGPDVGAKTSYGTSHPGIFAVGDVRAGSVKRVASAVGEGSVVISKVWDYLNTH